MAERINRVTDYLDRTAEKFPNKVAYLDDNRELIFAQMKEEAYKLAATIAKKRRFQEAGWYFPATDCRNSTGNNECCV